ncbi:uncharacterized protein LOC109814215 [Cajanus cajan]|uniref:uncharacterized protein LOC109814215 n=1 Tax=Cajanus cajan TaxID=3821 RepID=UPI00098DA935|nr:uncharacterized protein LOC109814215 [Cajanus cajan]
MIEGHEVNKVLVDGGAAVNILPRTMLKRFGKSTADLKPNNILMSDYAGNSSHPESMILLDVQIGSVTRTTMFIFFVLGAFLRVVSGLEVLDTDQKEYEVRMYFADQQLTAFAKTRPFDAHNAGVMDEEEGLDRGLVEHRLAMILGKKPVKQSPRRFAPEVIEKIKEEIERLLKTKFIRTSRYAEWISNIVPVIKRNGKLRVCIDFRDLNTATSKDEYPMPIAKTMIDAAAAGEFLGFVIYQKGIEVDRNKTKAIMETRPPSNKKELQSLLGKVNFLRRFISNLSGKTKVFSPLLRLKKEEEFR